MSLDGALYAWLSADPPPRPEVIQDTPFYTLPTELVLRIAEHLDHVDQLCIRRTSSWIFQIFSPEFCSRWSWLSRPFRRAGFWMKYPEMSEATRRELVARLWKDGRKAIKRRERWYTAKLCCVGCWRVHHRQAFTVDEVYVRPRRRMCKVALAQAQASVEAGWAKMERRWARDAARQRARMQAEHRAAGRYDYPRHMNGTPDGALVANGTYAVVRRRQT